MANEETLLLMAFPCARKLGNICCGHTMLLNKIRNIFCVPDTKFVSATNIARGQTGEHLCRQQCVLVSQGLYIVSGESHNMECLIRQDVLNGQFEIMMPAIDWQTLFPMKSLPVIPCIDNTEKERVFSAHATARCLCRWRDTEDISETKPSLDGCLLACFRPPLLRKERFAKMGHNFPAKLPR